MSNSRNILYLFAFMLLMLTGCEAESSLAPLPDGGEEPVEVRFHAWMAVADVSVARSEYTAGTALQEGGSIGIWNEYYDNLQMTCKETDETDSRTTVALETADGSRLLYPYATRTMTVCAYAPYVVQPVDGTIEVTTEWEPAQSGAKDPLWGSVEVEKAENVRLVNAALGLAHRMARLQVAFRGEARKVSVTLTFDAPQYGVMSLWDGTMTPATQEEARYTLEVADDGEAAFDRTVLPGSTLKTVQVTLTDDTDTYTYSSTIEKEFNSPGMIHRLNIDLEGVKEKGDKL